MESFRNFSVMVGDQYLIDRNEDFYSELTEWVDGIIGIMKNGNFYFSTNNGFAPFFATLIEKEVLFETATGSEVSADFYSVLKDTITFLYEQAKDENYSERESMYFYNQAKSLLDAFRFRYKDRYKDFVTDLMQKQLIREEVVVL